MKVDTVGGSGGQWGVSRNNYERLFYYRAGVEIPSMGFQINPVYSTLDFPDQHDVDFSKVWSIIPTPDVQEGPLRLRAKNETLNYFTTPCGQFIFRGERLPVDFIGNYILCEPVARVIGRTKLITEERKTYQRNIYYEREFISSTDMNFKPVNTATGLDGNLYIVDMHRGIIQQGNWTKPDSFLRTKIDSIGLVDNVGRGRIYRLVYKDFQPGPKPSLMEDSSSDLIVYVDHPNGWWRDNAQKEIIARNEKAMVPALRNIATGRYGFFWNRPSHLSRIHALWTLEGMEEIDKWVLKKCLKGFS